MSGETVTKADPFWSQNFKILFHKDRLVEFYPSTDMTYNEKLNAISRMFLYTGVLLLMYTGNTWPIYLIVGGLLTTYVMFHFHSKRKEQSRQEIAQKASNDVDDIDVDNESPQASDLDSNLADTAAELNGENEQTCTKPTRNNPFMNYTVNEILDNPTRPAACDYTDPKVNKELEDHFNYNLYKDIDDLFDKNNSQNRFVTMPFTTIPNDQGGFARWLYDTPVTCKEDQEACLDYEDLRRNRKPVGDFDHNPANLYGI